MPRKVPVEYVLPDPDGKRCSRCKSFKPWAAFHRNKVAGDGHQSCCAECGNEARRQTEVRNAESIALRRSERLARAPQAGTKECRKCGERKPMLAFYTHRSTKDGRTNYCAECMAATTRAWRERNAEKVREHNARSNTRQRGDVRRWTLKQYGLSEADYDWLLEQQGGVCAICLLPERYIDPRSGLPRRLAVDHDHQTNRVRGLLCGRCNRSIGQFADDHERLRRAADYLLRAESLAR